MKKNYILLAVLLIMVLTGCSGDNATTSATEPSSLVSAATSQEDGSTSATTQSTGIITPVDGSGCIVDYTNHQIYGLDSGITSLNGYVNIASGYALSYTPTKNGFGTGTVVKVKNAVTTVESYTIVIFGDVNGDGNIDSIDAGMIVDFENFRVAFNGAQRKAGDVNGDGNIDTLDAGIIVDVENQLFYINQRVGIAYLTSLEIRSIGPAGGWIFYDKGIYSNGWRYLEAAHEDQSTGAVWGTWGKDINGALGTAMGTGKQNTLAIIAGDSKAKKAADICANYSVVRDGVTYKDWFLPSKDELYYMYAFLQGSIYNFEWCLGDYTGNHVLYWSSSQRSWYTAWALDWSTHNTSNDHDDKDTTHRVRAIRAF